MRDPRSYNLPDLLDTAFVAAWMGVSTRTVQNWINSGVLPAFKMGHTVRIERDDFIDFFDRNKKTASRS